MTREEVYLNDMIQNEEMRINQDETRFKIQIYKLSELLGFEIINDLGGDYSILLFLVQNQQNITHRIICCYVHSKSTVKVNMYKV